MYEKGTKPNQNKPIETTMKVERRKYKDKKGRKMKQEQISKTKERQRKEERDMTRREKNEIKAMIQRKEGKSNKNEERQNNC